MNVKQIMSQNVAWIAPETTISKAAEIMRERDIGFLPICDNGRLAGTVTDRDITIRSVAQGRDPRLAPVRDIMSQQIFYCFEDDDVECAGRTMREKEVRRIVILNRDKLLVGVVSLGDIAKASGETQLAGETLGQITEAA